jgi:DNA-binding response OmpR family regulator
MNEGRVRVATVLLVEDDPSLRMLCAMNLEMDGHRVLEAPTLGDARAHLENEEIDLVLLDVHVVGESGYDLIEPIRSLGRPPIVLMSGTAEVGEAERRLVDAVVAKPFDPEELSAVVRRLAYPGESLDSPS